MSAYMNSSSTKRKQIDLYFKDINTIIQKDKERHLGLNYIDIIKSLKSYILQVINDQANNNKPEQLELEVISNCLKNELNVYKETVNEVN